LLLGDSLLHIGENNKMKLPLLAQCVLKNGLISSFPPLFCDEAEWKNWYLTILDAFNDFKLPKLSFQALDKRNAYVGSCQEYYFKNPPNIERGFRQFLYDIHGRAYLDVVNNVAVVGHAHPKLAEVVEKQLRRLNTNSRFVYSAMSDYAEKIVNTLPESIRDRKYKVIFVNSGSEATDLALRLARTVVTERRKKKFNSTTGNIDRDVICVEGGYHGITTASDEVSTTLNDNPK
jgi:4-aminobutyrate aminotransferase-like enzyme